MALFPTQRLMVLLTYLINCLHRLKPLVAVVAFLDLGKDDNQVEENVHVLLEVLFQRASVFNALVQRLHVLLERALGRQEHLANLGKLDILSYVQDLAEDLRKPEQVFLNGRSNLLLQPVTKFQ